MNERIEKLAEQADLLGDFTPTKIDGRYVGYINVADIKKFAELIVGECIDVMKSTVDESIDFERKLDETSSWIESDIKKHFGVEE